MPRGNAQRLSVAEPVVPNSLIASAALVTRPGLGRKSRGNRAWQNEAWGFYDTVGELRAAVTWLSNAMSRVHLQVIRRDEDGTDVVETGLAAEAVAGLFDGESGQSQALKTITTNLGVPGEVYVVAEPKGKAPDEWTVSSSEELRSTDGKNWSIDRGDGRRDLDANALVMRMWQPHPRKYVEADSAVRAVLPILREVVQLTKHVAATTDSRLAGAGILLLPSEMTFQTPQPNTIPGTPESDPFFEAFTEAMLTPIEDRASAAAVVPLVLRAPGAVLGNAKHITFSTPFDAQAQSLREEALRRLALGMDLPPEIMLGTGQANHWSAWQIDESALKIYIEPLCELITDAFTRKWLWPILELNNSADYELFVHADTSDLRVRPNHASEAVELYDRGQLSPEALRRETGFDESDAPTPEELQEIVLLSLVKANNDFTASAASALGVDLVPVAVGNNFQPVPPPQVEVPVGRDRDLPERRVASATLAATELLVLRALERANNRINRRGHQRRPCVAEEATSALADAWVNVPRIAEMLGVDPDLLTAQLNAYVTDLLLTGEPHSADRLQQTIMPRLDLVFAG